MAKAQPSEKNKKQNCLKNKKYKKKCNSALINHLKQCPYQKVSRIGTIQDMICRSPHYITCQLPQIKSDGIEKQ